MPTAISPFVKNVTTHVVLHEVGHALIREFDLPVLANEENMADSFSTNYITQNRRDDAVAIITHRAQSWLIEDQSVDPKNYDLKGEHELDKRRAYTSLCLLYGADPAQWRTQVAWVNFSQRDLQDCSDTAPHQIESWQKILFPFHHRKGQKSKNIDIIYGDGPYTLAMKKTGILEKIASEISRYNWPNTITLHFDHCSGGASWKRDSRTILICDNYIKRFIEQEKQLSTLQKLTITQNKL